MLIEVEIEFFSFGNIGVKIKNFPKVQNSGKVFISVVNYLLRFIVFDFFGFSMFCGVFFLFRTLQISW